MHASVARLSVVVAYLTFVGGLAVLCINLSRHVGTQAVTLAIPHVISDGERPPTLVERREIEAGPAVETAHPMIAEAPSVLEVPGISAPDLAAQLDLAERVDLASLTPSRPARGVRSRASRAERPVRIAAADVFGRSFGVMLRASR